jgi:hypothetical protein
MGSDHWGATSQQRSDNSIKKRSDYTCANPHMGARVLWVIDKKVPVCFDNHSYPRAKELRVNANRKWCVINHGTRHLFG